ncbi:ABC transporter substrate-binding protein [Paenibacillus massiliensis]|uniref:ABC transporter substrate-binding protein n=1 Tax=Paenibacillus massiliensis TaxID=225917 RepID=UPI001E36347C|nr:ABC transporter substrate-binding protein [Paenibacillus massiliensis]
MKLKYTPILFMCCLLALLFLLGGCGSQPAANQQHPANSENSTSSTTVASGESTSTSTPSAENASTSTSRSTTMSGTMKGTTGEPTTLTVGGPQSPPSLPILRMIDSHAMGENVQIEFKTWESMDTLGALAKDKNVSFVALPLNNAVIMYNKGMDLSLMNINTWSVMGMVTTDPSVKGWKDLQGTVLYVPMKSSPVDYITQTFLKHNGLIPGKDVTLQYSQIAEGAQLLLSGKASTIVSIQPQITAIQMKNEQVRSIVDYKKEWQDVTQLTTDLPNAGLATKQSVIASDPELVARFQEEYKQALQWTLDNPREAALLANKYFKLDSAVVEKAIPHMALEFAPAWESKEVLTKYYETLFEYSKDSIGGKLPDETFYYQP